MFLDLAIGLGSLRQSTRQAGANRFGDVSGDVAPGPPGLKATACVHKTGSASVLLPTVDAWPTRQLFLATPEAPDARHNLFVGMPVLVVVELVGRSVLKLACLCP